MVDSSGFGFPSSESRFLFGLGHASSGDEMQVANMVSKSRPEILKSWRD